jgi:hypothetical protein
MSILVIFLEILFWEFALLTGSVGGAGAAAKLSRRLAKTQWRQHGHIIIAFMLFVRFPAREAAPSGAPDSARALDCGAADFYFGRLAVAAELGGSFHGMAIARTGECR